MVSVATLLFLLSSFTTVPTSVNFVHSNTLTTVLDQAVSEDKLVFIDFYATWCGPCRKLDRTVFGDARVASYMNDNFVNYKVDIEKDNGPILAAMYGVTSLPAMIVLNEKGDVVSRKQGMTSPEYFMQFVERANAQ